MAYLTGFVVPHRDLVLDHECVESTRRDDRLNPRPPRAGAICAVRHAPVGPSPAKPGRDRVPKYRFACSARLTGCGASFHGSPGFMQRRLTDFRDTPKIGQSSPAIPVNLRCISTAATVRSQIRPHLLKVEFIIDYLPMVFGPRCHFEEAGQGVSCAVLGHGRITAAVSANPNREDRGAMTRRIRLTARQLHGQFLVPARSVHGAGDSRLRSSSDICDSRKFVCRST